MKVETESHFNFHFSNGYEENDNIIFDTVCVDDMYIASKEKIPVWEAIKFKDVPYNRLERFTLTPSKDKNGEKIWTCKNKKLDTNLYIEFPVINPKVSCKKNRYIWASCAPDTRYSSAVKGLVKIDTKTGEEQKWMGEPYEFLGECMFASKKSLSSSKDDSNKMIEEISEEEEDNGYILSITYNGKDDSSEFLIFDAKDISKGPISRQLLPVTVPHGLHGSFVPGLTYEPDEIIRKFKASLAVESKQWNGLNGGFSSLGLSFNDDDLV
eukprot:CAMPEP_0182440320 /NCGR_PEP_ID=MMETSP1167-20130531/86990_1 /TAXON_ID=2988 /ORGANISM="Mallomonas Sp, Strain CCMP3275" /LENGTH=267 /DNA_ID=CAMNT_0024634245 /DNA_START=959 /DNA_END=1758 /DNA_ORIENTATION=-